MQWLNDNAAGVQAITAIVIVVLTSALVGVTWWYARHTKGMARTLSEQLAASFQPNVVMTLTNRIMGQGGEHSDTVSGTITVHNKANLPLKVIKVAMKLIYDKAAFPDQIETIDAKQRVVAPDEVTQFFLTIDVRPGSLKVPYEQIVQIHCSDLASVSKHSFSVSSREINRTHHSCGFQLI